MSEYLLYFAVLQTVKMRTKSVLQLGEGDWLSVQQRALQMERKRK